MNGDSPFLQFAMANEPPFEDGTNLPRGTTYVAEPTGKVLPWYDPSESRAPSNWKEKWSALRARFERLIDECVPVESVMVQSRIPAYGWEPGDALPHLQRHPTIFSGGGLHSEPTRLYMPNWSQIKAAFPIKSVKGQPILNDAGEPVAYRFGVWRHFFVQPPIGWSPDVSTLPVPHLSQLARDATNLLYELPGEIAVGVWRNWLSGFSKTHNSNQSLWIDALFELSWQQPPGGPLHSNRSAWAGNCSYGLIGDGLFPLLPSFISSKSDGTIPHEHGYPVAYYSRLQDVARASVAAIDLILERAHLMRTSARRFSVGLSFAGEHRRFVEGVAFQLAKYVGKNRVLYDKYHEAEFAQPNLDVYLPELYRTQCDLIAVFLCREYESKHWCKLEWRFIRQLIVSTEAKRIMFLNFDKGGAPPELGILPGDGYVPIGNRSPIEIANVIRQRIEISSRD